MSNEDDMLTNKVRTRFGVNPSTTEGSLNRNNPQKEFWPRALTRLCLGTFLAAGSVGSGLAQGALTTGIYSYFFSPYDVFAGCGSAPPELAASSNYLLPSRFLIGMESDLSSSAEPAKGPAIYNDALELFGNACATPTKVPTALESTQPTDVPLASDGIHASKPDDTAPGLMDELSKTGHHDIHDETWNFYGQLTTIGFYKPPFHATYTNVNGSNSSLKPNAEESLTQTLSLFFGLRLRHGTEIYIVPEEISETTLSNLKGLGGATENFELQKVGTLRPTPYRSRLFVRQTFGFGGQSIELPSGQMQLGEHVDSRRLVFTVGNFGVLDIFDKNNVIGDLRTSFFDEAFMTYPAWDFPADARGYTMGSAAELYWDRWAVRIMRGMPPVEPNSQTLNFQPFKYYGDQVEVEHDQELFNKQPGAVRLLLYSNRELMGKFTDAIAAFESNPAEYNAANCGNLYN